MASQGRVLAVPGVLLCGLFVALSVILWSEPAPARPIGVQGFSNNPGLTGAATCAECHSGGIGGDPTVTISAPSTVTVGEPSIVTITISGGPGVVGGFNASFDDFQGQPVPIDSETRQAGPEITHTAPKAFDGDQVSFQFSWTPPDDTSIALYVSGLSANGNGSLVGDSVGTASAVIQIAQPEPTPTATATPLPTATPVPTATAVPGADPTVTPVPSATAIVVITPAPTATADVSQAAALPYPGPFTIASPTVVPALPAAPATLPTTPAQPPASLGATLAVTASPSTHEATIGLSLLAAGLTTTVYARRRSEN